MSTWRAMVCSRSVTRSMSAAAQSSASVTERVDVSAMLFPSTVTARVSGRRRLPWQVGQGLLTMNFTSSVRMYSDSVSLKRRSRLVTTPSNVATYEFSPRSWR